MRQLRPWPALVVLAAAAFILILIRIALREYALDMLFREQMPVHTPARWFVVPAVVAPFGVVLPAPLLGPAVAKSSAAVAYVGSWLVSHHASVRRSCSSNRLISSAAAA